MTRPDPLTQYLSGSAPYPFGLSLREHMSAYVQGIPHAIKLGGSEIRDLRASAADLEDDDPLADDYRDRANRLATVNETMNAVYKDLTSLLEFVDWENSFHDVGDRDLRPGVRSLVLKLVGDKAESQYRIALEIHSGSERVARIEMSRDEVIKTRDSLTDGLRVLDDANTNHLDEL